MSSLDSLDPLKLDLSKPDPSKLTVADLVSLQSCQLEPIRRLSYIQPHGMLLTLQEPDLTILQASENGPQFLGLTGATLVGQSLQQLFPSAQVRQIVRCTAQLGPEARQSLQLKIKINPEPQDDSGATPGTTCSSGQFRHLQATLHRSSGALLLELEPLDLEQVSPIGPAGLSPRLRAALVNLRQAKGLAGLAQTLAQEIKALTGFDRVMVYQFEVDYSGVVIAESKPSHLESYLGLHYPATDIPPEARELFYQNWLRLIPDVNYSPAAIVPAQHPLTGEVLDLSAIALRGVSSPHIQYLQNMGVAASMTLSLVDEKQLWGLVACHHYSPRYIDHATRTACEFLGQFASLELVHRQEQELVRYRTQVKSIQDQMHGALVREPGLIEQVLRDNAPALLNLVQAQGMAIVLDNQLATVGQTPTQEAIWALVEWLLRQDEPEQLVFTDCLVRLYPHAEQLYPQASGLLAISILVRQPQRQSYHLLWFRPEQVQTVNWAGKLSDAVTVNPEGELRLCPRQSFKLWQEIVRGKSFPWQPAEIEAAREMRNTLMMAVLEFSQAALELAAERAAIASRAKSQFLAKMSHELRTPLNAILGFTQLMHRDRTLTDEFREHLDIISRSGEHLLALINDVLEMSKIEAGQLMLVDSCFDLHRLLYAIKDMFILKAADRGLELRVERSPDLPRYVCGDEGKLRQILINLLGNAIKFTFAGHITLRVKGYENPTGGLPAPYTLHIEVEDTGPGIAAQDCEAIFEAFMQTDRGRYMHGTGLGLSISRQFARLMEGDITVQSLLGQGSTFTCRVQLTTTEAVDVLPTEALRYVSGLAPEQPAYRILVVEDNPENCQLLVKLLEAIGFEVCAVENGADAIALYQEWHPHLICMDIQMPQMNGYEATRHIRQLEQQPQSLSSASHSRPPHTKIIALTANAFAEDQDASLKAGCDDFVAKPFSEAGLLDCIARHLGVRYTYAEDDPPLAVHPSHSAQPLSASSLRSLPQNWVIQVHEAALDLDETQLQRLIAELPAAQKPLAAALQTLVEGFRFETLVELTQL